MGSASFKLRPITFVLFSIIFIFVSCDVKESDEIEEQNGIYGKYYASKSIDSNKVRAKVIFHEKSGKIIHDYVALRGDSRIYFQNAQMQEVKNPFNQITYEAKLHSRNTRSPRETVQFQYRNNDNKTFRNTVNFPSFVRVNDYNGIGITNQNGVIGYRFSWEFYNSNRNLKSSKVEVEIRTTDGAFTFNVTKNPAVGKFKAPNTYIKNIRLCSTLTEKANGASNRDEKISRFCDKWINL